MMNKTSESIKVSIEEMVNYQLHNMFPTTAYIGEMNDHARHKEVFYREIYPKYEFPHGIKAVGTLTPYRNIVVNQSFIWKKVRCQ